MKGGRELTRRSFVTSAAAAGAGLALGPSTEGDGAAKHERSNPICVFTKPFQSLSFGELADRIAELGVDGIEATIRDGGHIEPARVKDELPAMVEALRKRGLEITIMTSSINRADAPHAEESLRTAAALGIKRYRMKYYKYDLRRSVATQLDEFRPIIRDLVALNRELGITALYQNHAGRSYVGAPLWDLYDLMKPYPVGEIGVAYDIRHATVEGGQCWPIQFNLLRPHLGAICAKDFRWDERRVRNVPLGEGLIDEKFFTMLRASSFRGPISLHEEYIDHRDPALVPRHLAAIRKDLAVLRQWMHA